MLGVEISKKILVLMTTYSGQSKDQRTSNGVKKKLFIIPKPNLVVFETLEAGNGIHHQSTKISHIPLIPKKAEP